MCAGGVAGWRRAVCILYGLPEAEHCFTVQRLALPTATTDCHPFRCHTDSRTLDSDTTPTYHTPVQHTVSTSQVVSGLQRMVEVLRSPFNAVVGNADVIELSAISVLPGAPSQARARLRCAILENMRCAVVLA